MKKYLYVLLTLCFILTILPNGASAADAPEITYVSNAQGTAGDRYGITVLNHSPDMKIYFGTNEATITMQQPNLSNFMVIIPSGTGKVNITVVNSVGTSNAVPFIYYNTPYITGITPSSGNKLQETAVTITGGNFETPVSVMFGSEPATNVQLVNSTSITCVTPLSNEDSALVKVTCNGKESNEFVFTYSNPEVHLPTITSVSPSSGPVTGGTLVTITGTNLGDVSVMFNNTPVSGTIMQNGDFMEIHVVTPAHSAGFVDVSVTNPDGTATLTDGFEYEAADYGISLTPSTDKIFGAAEKGYAAQTSHEITVENTGTDSTGSLAISLSGTNADSFTLSASSIASLGVGGTDNFTVVPKDDLDVGNYEATVTVSGTNGISQSVNVSFTVNHIYDISLTPSTDKIFGAAEKGYAAQTSHEITVENTGTDSTGSLAISLSGTNADSFTLSASSIASLGVGGTDNFTVVPKDDLDVGNYEATVTVSGTNGISQSVNVSFTVNHIYDISLTPSTDKIFGAAEKGYAAQTSHEITVENTGTDSTGSLAISLSGTNADSFTLSASSIASLGVGGTDNFTVVPKNDLDVGNYEATVTVSGTNGISQSVNVSFTVNHIYDISLTPSTDKIFGAAEKGYAAQTSHEITVENTGTDSTGSLAISLSGTNADSFTLSASSIASLGVGGTDNFTVVPKDDLDVGNYEATVTVSGTNGISQSVNVSFTVNHIYDISLTPSTDKIFGAAEKGYAAQTPHEITVENTGTDSTGSLAISLSGTNADSFTLSASSIASLGVGGTDNFTVVPKNDLDVGNYEATVTVSGTNGISQSVNVSFTVNHIYDISLTPSTDKIFGAAEKGYAAQTPHEITVENTGTDSTGSLAISLSGTNADSFTLSASSIASLGVGGTDNFTVVPKNDLDVGNYEATVTVSGTNGISQSVNVSFTVNHIYDISLTPSTDKIFGAAEKGYAAQTPHEITVENTGTDSTGSLAISLSGTNADSFTLSASSIASLGVGGTDNFTVVPKDDLDVGNYEATVTVSGTNGISESLNVSFTVNKRAIGSSSSGSANVVTPSKIQIEAWEIDKIASSSGFIVITGLPDTFTFYIGEKVNWTPSPEGGTWTYDKNSLKMIENGGEYTFEALKKGNTTAIYSIDGLSHTVSITVEESDLSLTKIKNFWPAVLLLILAVIFTAIIVWRYQKKHSSEKKT
ncbi:choice-of-anchor D domain-containing protein [Methanolapillus millepedarum]|uniref:IPT/TIG domain-containing protein n=1 Tax=Methanolapillus millepedarum TaxID=3028296 RepID=A0AA96VCQ7_9EURY|nr:hypothetical protein MsAc7_13780 [Methanosarcinaceae archaeon Ac7]